MVPTEFQEFNRHIDLFEASKAHIVKVWVEDPDVQKVLKDHGIKSDFFAQRYAINVLEYFLRVVKGDAQIGDCPVMGEFLQYLRDQDLCSTELFRICTKFRRSMGSFTYEKAINSLNLSTEIATIFDKNFEGVLDRFNKTIKQAELDLKTNQRLLEHYKEAMDEAGLVSKTDLEGTITYANDNFCDVSGYTREELIGQNHRIVRHPDVPASFFDQMWRDLSAGNAFHDIIKNRSKSGKAYYVDSVIVPLYDSMDQKIGYMSVRHNITEQVEALQNAKEAEHRAREAQKEAVGAAKAKDDFLANMSHEIRTPLNAILGFVSLLQKQELDSESRGYLDVIASSGQSLLAIINDILDFAKIRSGKFELDFFEFDPVVEMEKTIELFTSKMDEKSIEYLVYIDPNLPKTVKADGVRIKQVILNFLSNAVKFTPEKGFVKVKVGFDSATQRLSVYINDSGRGIKPENLERVFYAFSQEKRDTSRKYGGTGLGLSICKSLTDLMDGEIGVESEEGKGSTFYVHIPVKVIAMQREWNLKGDAVIIDDEKFSATFALLKKYLSAMKVSYRTARQIVGCDGTCPVICSFDFYKKLDEVDRECKQMVVIDRLHDEYQSVHADTFKLFLPLYPSKVAKIFALDRNVTEDAEHTLYKHFDGDILVAEDNKTNQQLLTILLSEYGIRFDLAEDGAEAVDLFMKKKYDLVLMDINMPRVDGIQATEKILAFEQEKGVPYTPIVALTANASTADKERFLAAGMDDFLSKPIDITDFERVLGTYLRVGAAFQKSEIPKIQKSPEVPKEVTKEEPKEEPKKVTSIDLDELSKKIGLPAAMIEKLVDTFIEDTPNILEDLHKAVREKDLPNIQLYAHSIKGSAANLSLDELQAKAKEMEFAVKESRSDYDYESAYETVLALFRSVKK